MNIFNINKNEAIAINQKPFKLESEIQQLVESNTEEFFQLEFIKSEVKVGNYRIDTLCFDNDTNSFVIIEYKKGSSYSVIDQGYTYLQLLLNNKAEFLLLFSEHLNKVIKTNEIDWSQSRIIFISQSFNNYQKDSMNFKNLPFELWEINKYSNDLLILDKHQPTSNESIDNLANISQNNLIQDVNKEVKVYEESFHSDKLNSAMKVKWQELRSRLVEIENIGVKVTRSYIKFEFNGKGLCYCGFKKDSMNINMIRGNIKTDGSLSKNYFNLDDPKQIAKEASWEWKSGVKGTEYKIPFNKNSDIDYFIFLIKQKIKQLSGE